VRGATPAIYRRAPPRASGACGGPGAARLEGGLPRRGPARGAGAAPGLATASTRAVGAPYRPPSGARSAAMASASATTASSSSSAFMRFTILPALKSRPTPPWP